MGGHQHLKTVPPEFPCRLHADLVDQVGRALPLGEGLVAVVGRGAAGLLEPALRPAHLLHRRVRVAVDPGDQLADDPAAVLPGGGAVPSGVVRHGVQVVDRELALGAALPLHGLGDRLLVLGVPGLLGVAGVAHHRRHIPLDPPQAGYWHSRIPLFARKSRAV